jgi:acetylornithine deacetylase/succinyl-diaminopimelate desuccinylase-like protein
MANDANAVLRLAEAVTRLGNHEWPVRLVPSVERLLREVCEVAGIPFDPADPQASIDRLGGVARMVATTVRHSTTPTGFSAGGKVNVIPSHAEALIDGRFLPGHEEEFFTTVDELLGPHVRREFVHHDIAVEAPFDGRLVDVMTSSLLAEDPQARVVPYCLSGGTDAKSLDPLGIRCYGFAPLRLPPGLDFAGMFHGVDERVPVDALQFGVRVLDRFLRAC